jgi:sugar lactone lactonase YvrE
MRAHRLGNVVRKHTQGQTFKAPQQRRVASHLHSVAACSAILSLALAACPASAMLPDRLDRVSTPITSTFAGSGLAGRTDGPARNATFLTPTGVAIGNDGSLYVSDIAAQNIRRIHAGVVETFAGVSDPGNSPESRAGGYADGSVRSARFNRPIALATHGAELYVADAGNHCIRRIVNGVVQTIARNFTNLKGVSVTEDGTIYAADDGVGIRRIATSGTATILALPSDHKAVLGVATRAIDGHQYLAYTDVTHIYLEQIGAPKPQVLAYDEEREPDSAGVVVGHAYAVAILNENTVLVTDTTTHAVRLVRFPAPPFVAGRVVRDIAGGIAQGSDTAGAFAEGPPARARLDTPTALAIAADGTVYVADAGNRRIRAIAGVDSRESVLPDLSNFAIPDRSYHIAIVGNSYAFYNVLWPESIGGRLETALARDAASIGLTQRPAVTTFRIDAASDDAQISVIHEYLFDHRTDLIVLLLNSYVAMRSETLVRLKAQLATVGIKLLVVFTPQGFEVAPSEFWSAKRDTGEQDFVKLREPAARDETYYNMTGVRGLYLLDAMEAHEEERNRQPLFYSSEHHLTIYGSEWVGRRIAEAIEAWKPWRAASDAAPQ